MPSPIHTMKASRSSHGSRILCLGMIWQWDRFEMLGISTKNWHLQTVAVNEMIWNEASG